MQTGRQLFRVSLAALVIGASLSSLASAEELKSKLNTKIEDFSVKDFRGETHELSDYADSKLIVVAFMGTECPLVKLYAPRLQELADEYADRDVTFLAVNSNQQDSITEMGAFARIHDLKIPILKDLGNGIADAFGAVRTPEIFVLDSDRVIRYRGRIDNQYGISPRGSYQKPAPDRHDLTEAIDELLAGEQVSVPETEAVGCIIGRVRDADNESDVTYSNQIARIFNNHCVECHRDGQIAPFSLTSYEETLGWGEMIAEVVSEQRMPPWHADPQHGDFSNDIRLSDEQRKLIFDWVDAGCPEGDPGLLPEIPTFTEGWQLPREPDMIVKMGDEPFEVAADETVEYQYFIVDPGFTEDKWVKVAECMPDNRRVVHHIIVFLRPPAGEGRSRDRDARGFHFLAGYAPGTRPFVLPDGMAKKIPAGSKFVFQMHYTPCGSVQKDLSSIGLVFVGPDEVEYQVATTNVSNHSFEIPAHESDHPVNAQGEFKRDTLLLSLFPHMHLRGKAFRYETEYPDGTREVLLDVPQYDFNWQNSFILAEPKMLPKGTKMFCSALFDNSEENLANPDPTETVRWGDQTWEEMMIGWYDIALPVAEAEKTIEKARQRERGESDADPAAD